MTTMTGSGTPCEEMEERAGMEEIGKKKKYKKKKGKKAGKNSGKKSKKGFWSWFGGK